MDAAKLAPVSSSRAMRYVMKTIHNGNECAVIYT